MSQDYSYEGEELDLFAHAVNWKNYFRRRLQPFLRGDVLEVGAGLGGTTHILCSSQAQSWTCLEPDVSLLARLQQGLKERPLAPFPRLFHGTLDDLPGDDAFDAVLYIDVLEHIEDDAGELRKAVGRLRPQGRLIVLSPAHQCLFTPFDRAIGHFRRYDRGMLEAITPRGVRLKQTFYMDSVGMLASLANRLLLRSSMPTRGQIRLWDGWMVPCSTWIDPLLSHRLGKTIVAIWQRPQSETPARQQNPMELAFAE